MKLVNFLPKKIKIATEDNDGYMSSEQASQVSKIGNLDDLKTEDKSTLVGAVNEIIDNKNSWILF